MITVKSNKKQTTLLENETPQQFLDRTYWSVTGKVLVFKDYKHREEIASRPVEIISIEDAQMHMNILQSIMDRQLFDKKDKKNKQKD